jgi:hypothetical protein
MPFIASVSGSYISALFDGDTHAEHSLDMANVAE